MDRVEQLKAKVAEWTEQTEGDDIHAIGRQITMMLWRSAFYRSINESRQFLPIDSSGEPAACGWLHELINEGYVTMHAAAIRRLLDRSPSVGPRGVFSLHSLVRDIRASHHLLTRENVLAARDLPYEYQSLKLQMRQEAARRCGGGAARVSREGWGTSEYWHKAWDRLCGIDQGRRSPDDQPPVEKLDRLLEELAHVANDVSTYATQFIAHAATPESRAAGGISAHSVSLDTLWKAEAAVVKVANFLSLHFVSGVQHGGVPSPAGFDLFMHLEQPFVNSTAVAPMREAWQAHCDEIQACGRWFWDAPLAGRCDGEIDDR